MAALQARIACITLERVTMSWTFCSGITKTQLIKDLLTTRHDNQTLDHIMQGNTLWVVQLREKDPCIVCYRIAQEQNLWGYQDLLEGGTTPVNCPLLLLELAPPVDRKWRDRVRAYHAEHNKHPKVQDIWSLKRAPVPHIRITNIGSSIEGTYMGHKY